MNPKKIKSLQKKYDSIPPVYLPSYPGGEEYLEKKRMRKDDDYELPVKKKKKRGPGRPKRVEKIEKNTINKYLVAPFGARLLRKCSDEGDGERKGAGPNQASYPNPEERAGKSDDDYFESESEAEAETPVSHSRSKAPKKIPKH